MGMGSKMTGERLTLALCYGGTPETSSRGNSYFRWVLVMRAKIRRRKFWEEIPKSCRFEENGLFSQRAQKRRAVMQKNF